MTYGTIASIGYTSDYVANGSFAALRENVTYHAGKGFARLIRLQDYRNGWGGEAVYVDERSFRFLRKSALQPRDIIIANVGAYAGLVFRVPHLGVPMTLGPNAVLLRVFEGNSADYVYDYLSSAAGWDLLRSIVSGSAQPKFNKTDLRALEIPLPPLPTQLKIAAILSAYDDLVENNTRRIKILEEMVHRLYREWLVDFRYPGHENVPLTNTQHGPIPVGWEWKERQDLAVESRIGVDPRDVDPNTPYIGLENMPEHSIAIATWGRASDAASRKYRYKVGNVLFGKIRPYFHKVVVPPLEGICSTDAIVIESLAAAT